MPFKLCVIKLKVGRALAQKDADLMEQWQHQGQALKQPSPLKWPSIA